MYASKYSWSTQPACDIRIIAFASSASYASRNTLSISLAASFELATSCPAMKSGDPEIESSSLLPSTFCSVNSIAASTSMCESSSFISFCVALLGTLSLSGACYCPLITAKCAITMAVTKIMLESNFIFLFLNLFRVNIFKLYALI